MRYRVHVLIEVLERSRQLGLLGPGLVADHVDHATGFVAALVELGLDGGRLLDLGSGGGIPGLVIATSCPDAELTLLDGSERRVAFLRDSIRRLELHDRVRAIVGRAEIVAHDDAFREQFDAVVSRSFGPPAVTAECAVGFLRSGGHLLVSDPGPSAEPRWPRDGLLRAGLESTGVRAGHHSSIRVLRRVSATLGDLPRVDGVPRRRPLF